MASQQLLLSSGTRISREEARAQIAQLKELAKTAQNDQEARLIISRIAQVVRKFRVSNGIGASKSPLAIAQSIDDAYSSRPHLEMLSTNLLEAVQQVEKGNNQQLITSMPPRAGKSTMTSLFAPLWLLQRHPEWKIVMTSYDGGLTASWARQIRHMIEDKPDLGIALRRDGGAGGRWTTVEGGGMYSVGIGGALTGRGAKVMIIDDPISDFVAAHSPRIRQNLWNWWLSVAQTRLEPPYLVIVTMCMTGDTPVLRPDGTETALRDIRPGDEIATYENGRLSTSIVRNWASQGPDWVYRIRMSSGRSVRANARHPFLVVMPDGSEQWVRLGSLEVGMRVRSATAPTGVSPALSTAATSRPSARACACRTTVELDGLQGIDHLLSHRKPAGTFGSRVVTESLLRSTSDSLMRKMVDVQSATFESMKSSDRSTGLRSSVSITTMTPERCEACSATTATSSSHADTPLRTSVAPLPTWSVDTDEIVAIEPEGVEEVFDIQVDRTENFIANGLTAHNTRWHEDDFVGRLLSPEHEGDPREWHELKLPALADSALDQLGRSEGQPLYSPLLEETEEQAVARWTKTKEAVGTYTFSAMYQQRPAPQAGAIFDMGWWRFWTRDPERATEDGRVVYLDPGGLTQARWIDSWDCTFKGAEGKGDYVVGQRWAQQGANRYLIGQTRDRWSFTQTIEAMMKWSDLNGNSTMPNLVHERIIESAANGHGIMDVLQDKIPGIKGINPRMSKEARARAITPEVESGNVYLPHPKDLGNEWVDDLLSELRNFPYDAHDDQVDALTQALNFLRGSGRASITVPGAKGRDMITGLAVPRNITAAAYTDAGRRRYQ